MQQQQQLLLLPPPPLPLLPQLQLQLQLHYITQHYATLSTLHYITLLLQLQKQLQLITTTTTQLHNTTLHLLHCTTLQLHYFTLHYTILHYTALQYTTLQYPTLNFTYYTTPQLQLQLDQTTSSSRGRADHRNQRNHFSVQWIRSAIRDSQRTSPFSVSYFWNFRHRRPCGTTDKYNATSIYFANPKRFNKKTVKSYWNSDELLVVIFYFLGFLWVSIQHSHCHHSTINTSCQATNAMRLRRPLRRLWTSRHPRRQSRSMAMVHCYVTGAKRREWGNDP